MGLTWIITPMSYTHLLLDADGTLYDFDRSQAQALQLTFQQIHLVFQPATMEIYHHINERLWTDFENGLVSQERLVVQRFERLFQELANRQPGADGWAMVDASVFNDAYIRNLANSSILIDGAEAVIQALHGKVRMSMLSNGLALVQRGRIEKSSIRKFFDHVIISEEVGAAKPDPRIFEAAFQQMGNPPKAQVLMVGDSLNADVRGANSFGIDVCWYNPNAVEPPQELNIRYTIDKLNKLLEIMV